MISRWLPSAALSALFAGLTAVFAKAGLAGVSADLATLLRTGLVLVFLTFVYAILHGAPRVSALGARAWIFLALSAAATALSWLYYFRALQMGPVAGVAAVDKASLLVAVCAAAAFLGERLTLRTLAGSLLITAGVLLITLRPR
jgi:transporter family protein